MAPRFLTILTGRNLPKIQQPGEPEPSIINEKPIADFTRKYSGMTGMTLRQPVFTISGTAGATARGFQRRRK